MCMHFNAERIQIIYKSENIRRWLVNMIADVAIAMLMIRLNLHIAHTHLFRLKSTPYHLTISKCWEEKRYEKKSHLTDFAILFCIWYFCLFVHTKNDFLRVTCKGITSSKRIQYSHCSLLVSETVYAFEFCCCCSVECWMLMKRGTKIRGRRIIWIIVILLNQLGKLTESTTQRNFEHS